MEKLSVLFPQTSDNGNNHCGGASAPAALLNFLIRSGTAGNCDNETIARQDMAWNKGKNCLETFGPSNSRLPEIAAKAGCRIVASVPESAVSGKKFTSEDAKELLAEVGKLRPALAADGKMAVHRYGGVVDKLESMAKVCAENGCGFYFF